MNETIAKIQSYLKELQGSTDKYIAEAPALIDRLYATNSTTGGKRRPEKVNDSSFLYIRSYGTDLGVRPFSNITFWNSPDITVTPMANPGAPTTALQAGQQYNIQCTVNNRGDITVPTAKVEFFLCTPSLGFDTRYAENIALTQLDSFLLPLSSGSVNVPFDVQNHQAGHRCLFARTYSFSPLDKPISLYGLDPTIDRHIGQKNLNITGQAQNYNFQLIHTANAQENIKFVPLSKDEIIGLQHPALGNFRFRENAADLVSKLVPVLESKGAENVTLKAGRAGFDVISQSKEGMSVERQQAIQKQVDAAIAQIYRGAAPANSFKALFKEFNAIFDSNKCSKFNLKIPDFGLAAGEAIAVNIVNTNVGTGKVKGGITLIITGNK
ncbi:hypothetical protein [Chitinophaga sp. sic0106]|uniref:hypothetical protein n=1 Tax=Chitinophaga sp. sic0106 TaxID=2854785 RepID=UPI001C48213D|nr:hypothetical protein [Chitinophaga sp. sic0106]MBV7532519.1 hypothetical protein [Chitinophaga sp. sic0106]